MKNTNLNKDFNKLIKISYDVKQVNDQIKTGLDNFVLTCEKNYNAQVIEVANYIAKNKIKMLFVAGPSSAGKTTTSALISEQLLKKKVGSLVVSIDDFFVDLKDTPLLPDGLPDFDNFTTVDIKTFNKFYKDLMTKHKARMPRFSFEKHKRDKWEQVEINDNDVVIIEGLHALNPNLLTTNEFDDKIAKLYICTNSVFTYKDKVLLNEREIRLMRRTYRDFYTRDKLPIYTFKQWKHVCEGEDLYITPYRNEADFFIDTTRGYEISLWANYFQDLLTKYKDEKELKEITKKLKHSIKISKDVIPDNSLLWEFLVNKEN